MLTAAITWGRSIMAEINDKKSDARQLWLPVTTIVGIVAVVFVGLIGAGMWIQRTNDKAATVSDVTAELKAVNAQLATMQGSINALMGMQSEVARARSDVDSAKDDIRELRTDLRLLKDFVEGRIGSMPYRPSSTEGGSR